MRFVKQGSIFLEATVVSALVIVALAFIANHFYKTQEIYKDIYGNTVNIIEEVQKAKQEAPLIIIGIITKIYDRANFQERREQNYFGLGYYDVLVQSVEKGQYQNEKITVGIGWFSNFSPPEIYSPFLKKNYRVGDRIRLFLYYNQQKNEYYILNSYYTIESV